MPVNKKKCFYCKEVFKSQGFTTHEIACARTFQEKESHYLADPPPPINVPFRSDIPLESEEPIPSLERGIPMMTEDQITLQDSDAGPPSPPISDFNPSDQPCLLLNYIHTEYHPSSSQEPKEEPFESYSVHKHSAEENIPFDAMPWCPYRSMLDFELSETILEAALNEGEVDALLKNITKQGGELLEFQNHQKLIALWDKSAHHRTPVHMFQKSTFTISLRDEDYHFDVFHRDLWSWTLDILQDPLLVPHLIWNAQKLFRCKGSTSEQFYTEPWTSNIFSEVQSALPIDGKPICYIIYADKTHLSSFRTVQGYPVIIRLGNLPAHIRNGQGIGGGRVADEPKHHNKSYYADFKRDIWHKAFEIILSSIKDKSKTRAWVQPPDADAAPWHVFPTIMILSADSEEHRNEFLKPYGLCYVKNVFWSIEHCDVHWALSFDRLHAFHNGLFGDHLCNTLQAGQTKWSIFIALIEKYNEAVREEYEVAKQAALKADKAPPKKLPKNWDFSKIHSLKHLFDDIEAKGVTLNYNTKPNESMHGSFKESYHRCTNFKDIAKQILRVDQWYSASSFIRQQINLHDQQLEASQAHVAEAEAEVEEHDASLANEEEAVMVQPDYTLAASVHGHHGKGGGKLSIAEVEDKAAENHDYHGFRACLSKHMTEHFKKCPEELPLVNSATAAFEGFSFEDLEVLLQIVRYKMLKSYYTSFADWMPTTDILRCSPSFNHCPRYNFVLAQTKAGPLFAQLVMIFKCNVHGKMFPLMLVQPFNQPAGGQSKQKDQDLGLYHVKTRPNGPPCLISIYSVLQGALLIEDTAAPKEYLAVDMVDSDMFLRMQSLSYTMFRSISQISVSSISVRQKENRPYLY
ncbi:hypothetical protein ARMGADRAFT_1033774 [Armillaria gallica]|uniref:Ubiquitin-like protease family profile domain-containing protein n=1 Tax=Armillaria gallica TaxID=47427 RepID=A0A2H3DKL1_ARMGA|nr:hypothetical protein ARMGADRAFT_1033774 [Armillaria gallica]